MLVIHEAGGLSEHFKDVTRRVSNAGYVAFAPELLSRWDLTPGLPVEKVMSLLANTKPEEIPALYAKELSNRDICKMLVESI